MTSTTPRTDAACKDADREYSAEAFAIVVRTSRQLETELTAMTAERDAALAARGELGGLKHRIAELNCELDKALAAIKRRDDILAEIADGKMYTGPSTCNCEICSKERREWLAAKLKGE